SRSFFSRGPGPADTSRRSGLCVTVRWFLVGMVLATAPSGRSFGVMPLTEATPVLSRRSDAIGASGNLLYAKGAVFHPALWYFTRSSRSGSCLGEIPRIRQESPHIR